MPFEILPFINILAKNSLLLIKDLLSKFFDWCPLNKTSDRIDRSLSLHFAPSFAFSQHLSSSSDIFTNSSRVFILLNSLFATYA